MKYLLAISVLLLAGCAHRARVARHPHVPTAIDRNFERHIANAIDAGEGDASLRDLRTRVASNPEDLEARRRLALHYEEAGAAELALEHIRESRRIQPDSAALAVEEARLLRKLSLREPAARVLVRFAETHRDAPAEVHAWLGIDLDALGQHAAAEKSHRAAVAADPNRAAWRNNLGYNLVLRGMHKEAAAELEQALALDPASAFARNNLMLARARLGVVPAGAEDAAARNNRAAAYIDQGRLAEAREELGKALLARADFRPALENLRLLSELDGRSPSVPAKAFRPVPPPGPRWRRFGRMMKDVFVGTWEAPVPPPAAPAGGTSSPR